MVQMGVKQQERVRKVHELAHVNVTDTERQPAFHRFHVLWARNWTAKAKFPLATLHYVKCMYCLCKCCGERVCTSRTYCQQVLEVEGSNRAVQAFLVVLMLVLVPVGCQARRWRGLKDMKVNS